MAASSITYDANGTKTNTLMENEKVSNTDVKEPPEGTAIFEKVENLKKERDEELILNTPAEKNAGIIYSKNLEIRCKIMLITVKYT